jgi:hypothetical protein
MQPSVVIAEKPAKATAAGPWVFLSAASDKDVSTFFDKQLGGRQCHTRGCSGYYCDFSFELLGHVRSPEVVR